MEVQIVDEDGVPAPAGETGEIVARGGRMMAGYWQEEGATRDVLRSGWVYTGDLGYRDEDNYIYLSGRSKDFIKRGGEMVSPEEVENVLRSHPQVDDAAVIGVPDSEWGEEVRAVVVSRSGTWMRASCSTTAPRAWPASNAPGRRYSSMSSPGTSWAKC